MRVPALGPVCVGVSICVCACVSGRVSCHTRKFWSLLEGWNERGTRCWVLACWVGEQRSGRGLRRCAGCELGIGEIGG